MKAFGITKHLSSITVLGAILLAVILAACGEEQTITPPPTSATTPKPITPPPSSATTPKPITVDPEEDPAGFQTEFPEFETLAEISAPMGIGTVVWPGNVQDASALLERLPGEISGHGLTERPGGRGASRYDFNFGVDTETQDPVLVAHIVDLTEGEFFPADTTAGDFIAFYAQGFDWDVLGAGRDGDLGGCIS